MKKHLLRLCIGAALALVMALNISEGSVPAYAKSKNVTSKMAKKPGIRHICKYSNMYVHVMSEWNFSKKKTKIQMTTNNRGKIVAYAICGLANSKVIDTNDNRYNYRFAIRPSAYKKTHKRLFGINPNIKRINFSSEQVIKSGNRFYVPVGDWSEGSYPAYRVTKICKTGRKTYKIILKNQRKDWTDNSRYSIGKTVIKIKTSRKSPNGYVITGLSYRLTRRP